MDLTIFKIGFPETRLSVLRCDVPNVMVKNAALCYLIKDLNCVCSFTMFDFIMFQCEIPIKIQKPDLTNIYTL